MASDNYAIFPQGALAIKPLGGLISVYETDFVCNRIHPLD